MRPHSCTADVRQRFGHCELWGFNDRDYDLPGPDVEADDEQGRNAWGRLHGCARDVNSGEFSRSVGGHVQRKADAGAPLKQSEEHGRSVVWPRGLSGNSRGESETNRRRTLVA